MRELPSETERRHAFEVVGHVYLAGCVRTHCQLQIVGMNAHAVVGHAHAFDAALFDRQHDPACLRVEAVLDQFPDDRGGLDDLTAAIWLATNDESLLMRSLNSADSASAVARRA